MAIHAALLADVQDSRAIEDFPRLRDRALAELSRLHRERGWCKTDYAVTAWDEFQGLLSRPAALPRVLWDAWRIFEPMRLRLAVGGGTVERMAEAPSEATVNTAFTGEAFYRAREAMDALTSPRHGMSRVLVAVAWDDPLIENACNSVLRLVDALVGDITPRQWQVIDHYEQTGRQTDVAAALNKAESTISRSLASARYWEIRASLDELGQTIEARLSQTGNGGAAVATGEVGA